MSKPSKVAEEWRVVWTWKSGSGLTEHISLHPSLETARAFAASVNSVVADIRIERRTVSVGEWERLPEESP